MKERILNYFQILSKKKDVDGILSVIINDTGLEKEVIFKRSKKIFHHILHNYSDLSVSTIDKFTSRLVRTFSKDIGLSYNFDIEMDNEQIIQPVVALLLSKISKEGGDLSKVLVNFAISKAEEGKNTDIEKDLQDFSNELFKENTAVYIDKNKINIKECLKSRNFISNKRDNIKEEIYNLSKKVSIYFNSHDIEKSHFLRGSFFNYFINYLSSNDDKKWIPTVALRNNIDSDIWCAKGADQKIKEKIQLCKDDLNFFFKEAIGLVIEYNSCRAILKNIYSIALISELKRGISKYKVKNNIESLSEFNKKINSIVSEQPAAFIYERIGERYNHYLIDEFQDTSLLQWQNLLPLLIDSLDYGRSIVVGDAKQSIYRWRGGKIEQFLQLPNLYKADHLVSADDWAAKLNYHYDNYNLSSNFRSRKEVIKFNNNLFSKIKSILSDELKDVYLDHIQELDNAKEGGYVHLELFSSEDDYKSLILDKIIDEINVLVNTQDCSYSDIAILCNSSKRISLVASFLSRNNIPVISNEGLLLSSSAEVNFLISILFYLQDQHNDIARTAIINHLYSHTLKAESLHELYIRTKSLHEFEKILLKEKIYLDVDKLRILPLYDMIENLISILFIKDDIYIQFFLDFVFSYTQKHDNNLASFLKYWQEKEDKETIIIPDGIDAVQVMTIHKSKGLAFNNVIIPFNWEDVSKRYDFWVDSSTCFDSNISYSLVSSNHSLNFSCFKNEYSKEQSLRLLDNLNKLYVAVTRARDRLYIFSKSFPSSIKDTFLSKGNLNSFLYHFSTDYPYISGKNFNINSKKEKQENLFLINPSKKANWRDILKLKSSDDWNNTYARDWGKLLHTVLAEIHYVQDKDKIVDSFFDLGKCTEQEYKRIKLAINDLFSSNDILEYFNDNWNVSTEKEILLNNGVTYIPDRLLFHKNIDEVVVIDYKTGEEELKHEEQIIKYSNALFNMGYKNVKRILIYTNRKEKIKHI